MIDKTSLAVVRSVLLAAVVVASMVMGVSATAGGYVPDDGWVPGNGARIGTAGASPGGDTATGPDGWHDHRVGTDAVAPVTTITSCRNIESSGVYRLGTDIETTSLGDCITINASDVTLAGAGHVIEMGAGAAGIRVLARGADRNVTVRNLTVRNASHGLLLEANEGERFSGLTARNLTTQAVNEGIKVRVFEPVRLSPAAALGSTAAGATIVTNLSDIAVLDSELTAATVGLGVSVELPNATVSEIRIANTTVKITSQTAIESAGVFLRQRGSESADGETVVGDVTLTGVTIGGAKYGVRAVVGAGHARLSDLRVVHSVVRPNESFRRGIQLLVRENGTARNVVVARNRLRGFPGAGIEVTAHGTATLLRSVTISDNIVTNTSAGIIVSADRGFNSRIHGLTIADNRLSKVLGVGIAVRGGSRGTEPANGITVVNNTLRTVSDDQAIDLTFENLGSRPVGEKAGPPVELGQVLVESNRVVGAETGALVEVFGERVVVPNVTAGNNTIVDTRTAVIVRTGGGVEAATVTVVRNEIRSSVAGILAVVDGATTRLRATITNNSLDLQRREAAGIQVSGDEANQRLDVSIIDNTVEGSAGVRIRAEGNGSTLRFDVSHNNLSDTAGGVSVTADVADGTIRGRIADNRITASASGTELSVEGINTTVDATITGNLLDDISGTGIAVRHRESNGGVGVSVRVRANEVEAATGIAVRAAGGARSATPAVVVDHNDVVAAGRAIEVSGAVNRIDLEQNILSGSYGVYNTNDSAVVDARHNYWNASDGPSSAGPYADPVTGTLANGSGAALTNGSGSAANVRFDPYLTEEPASALVLRNVTTNDPVREGETLRVTVTLETTGAGRASVTQEVRLAVAGSDRAVKTVTLTPGKRQTLTLTWATGSGDAGEYTANVRTTDDNATTRVTVREKETGEGGGGDATPRFEVTIAGTNSPIVAGENLSVEVSVANTGDARGSVEVTLSVAGVERDKAVLSLASDESAVVSLTWATAPGDTGNFTVAVSGGGDAAETRVAVREPAALEVRIASTNAPVTAGEQLVVTAVVENTGGVETTESVTLQLAGGQRLRRTVTLDPGESKRYRLTWTTDAGLSGQYTAEVVAGNASAATDVRIKPPVTQTPTPTQTPAPAPTEADGRTPPTTTTGTEPSVATTTAKTTVTARPETTGTAAPGIGVAGSLAALVAAAALLWRRRI